MMDGYYKLALLQSATRESTSVVVVDHLRNGVVIMLVLSACVSVRR